MFTRIVEVTTKNGRARDLCKTINDKVLPILKNQNGFVDEITLVSTSDPNRIVAISFWKTREDAQQYHTQQFNNVTNLIRQHLDGDPRVEPYEVDSSTAHKIAAGKAA
jgi:heme-degrading monooxygenase HmoA